MEVGGSRSACWPVRPSFSSRTSGSIPCATHAEEARNPRRDVPIGIIASLLICTVLYCAVAPLVTGMVPYDKIDVHAPVANAFEQVGLTWAQFIISVGA